MMLFDDVSRNDVSPGDHGEPIFQVLNHSARSSFEEVRRLSEALFTLFPAEGRAEIRSRFRSDNDRDLLSAFFELYWSGWLQRCGFELQVHPPAAKGKTTHPDFLVVRNGQPAFYLECCVCCDSDQQQGEDARLAEFYNALNKIPSPNFFLHVRVEVAPTSSFSMGGLRGEIGAWLGQLRVEETNPRVGQSLLSATRAGLVFRINRGGGTVVLTAVPKSPEGRGKPGLRTYGSSMGSWHTGESSKAILDSLKTKAKRYGVLQYPLVVAINCLDLFADGEAVATALFGYIRWNEGGMEAYRVESLPQETLWYRPAGPVNTRVAAVLATTHLYPWAVAAQRPVLWSNPWAKIPFKGGKGIGCKCVTAMPTDAAPRDGEQTVARFTAEEATASPCALFGLPAEWPKPGRL